MKKLVPSIFIFALVLFVAPSQTYAAWWNPISWFSSGNQIEEQNQSQNATSSNATQETQTANQDVGKVEQKNTPVSSNNTQSSDTKTIEELRTEVATLKASLDNLYTAHNALLKYVNATISSDKSIGATTNNSNLETKVTNLEKKLNDACAQIFSSIGGFGTKCPSSSSFITGGTLESRIKKLEGGF